jgi:hypothetical protein
MQTQAGDRVQLQKLVRVPRINSISEIAEDPSPFEFFCLFLDDANFEIIPN